MIGSIISHYKILEKLGEGGMGIVYKAQDTNLDRMVALKFLPPHLAASEQDKSRFVQEAKAASALNHPNVCTIHSIEEHESSQGGKQMFIVMEFVDGQTLREKKGMISFKQAVDIGIQIADGLAAAHEKGIVHRDIKPDNIMIRKDGIAQIMDFGLAKLRASGSQITRLTKEGSTVGTAGYMSPEQVQGQDTDHRSDIFSFGVLMYEMFTGQLPFRGVHETALMYEIVNVDAAPMSAIKPDIDSNFDVIVLDCLEKDQRERCQSVAEVARDLRRVKRESTRQRHSRVTAVRPAYQSTSGQSQYNQTETVQLVQEKTADKLPWIISALFFLIASGAVGYILFQKPAPPPEIPVTRAYILPPSRVNFNVQNGGHLAVSPNGKKVAFVGFDTTGTNQLWVRAIESLTAVPLAGTNGAYHPFWSPDGKSLAFFADGKLKKIDAAGGPVVTICDAPAGRGGTWNNAGMILLAPNSLDALYKVSAAGGVPVAATKLDTANKIQNHRWPHFLPDGKHFIYTTQTAATASENDVVRIASLDSSVDSVLMLGNSNVEYASGYLLFHRQAMLMAQPFDTATFRFYGDAVPIAEQLQYNNGRSRAMFSVSTNGVLIFQTGEEQQTKFAFFDRAGNRLNLLDTKWPRGGRLSHDGKKIAYVFQEKQSRQNDVWLYEINGGRSSRFTFDMATDIASYWSPHDDSVVFSSDRSGKFDLYIKSANGTGTEQLLIKSDDGKYVTDWSLNGKYLTYTSFGNPKTKNDMWLLPMTGNRTPVPFLQTEFNEANGSISPDAKWIAYQSDESGKNEVYVRALDGTAGKWGVSINGGNNPRWSRDGKTIFFQASGKAMGAAVRVVQSAIVVDSVRTFFDFESRGIFRGFAGGIQDVSGDGQKFLFMVTELDQTSPPITLVVNWNEELKKK
ncbi:MAG: protein kinase [Ignavibacteriae bacterium]|nr:protein kinase [Ignavibacteriota bacterium]